MQRILFICWLTIIWFMLLANVHAFNVPHYLRIDAGARMWFSQIDGDLIQPDRTKLGLVENLGVKPDALTWELFGSARFDNVHVLRVGWESWSEYNNAVTGSGMRIWDIKFAYDLDFYMTPQLLFGSNTRLTVYRLDSTVRNVTAGAVTYDYSEKDTASVPSVGLHGTFYPVVHGVALRPSLSSRVNWWGHQGTELLDWEIHTGVDIPLTNLWTWTLQGGYRYHQLRLGRDSDIIDFYRSGFFLQTSLLF